MAERTARPAAKKTAPGKAPAAKLKTTKAGSAKVSVKTVAKKAAASTTGKKSPTQKNIAARARPVVKKAVASLTSEDRYQMVQTAAYFIAERNGFCGCPIEYWEAAELEIANRLS